jgi:hypothetical protein
MLQSAQAMSRLASILGAETIEQIGKSDFRYLALNSNHLLFLGRAGEDGKTRGQELRKMNEEEVAAAQAAVEAIAGHAFNARQPDIYVALPGQGPWAGKWIAALTPPATDGFSFTIAEHVPDLVSLSRH